MPIQRQAWMFAYQYIHPNKDITFQRPEPCIVIQTCSHSISLPWTINLSLSLSFCKTTAFSAWLHKASICLYVFTAILEHPCVEEWRVCTLTIDPSARSWPFSEQPITVATSWQSTNHNRETEMKGIATIGTRWLCRRSAPTTTKKDPCKDLCFHRCWYVHTQDRLLERSSINLLLTSHAYSISTETMQPCKPHMHQLNPFCDTKCVRPHQYYPTDISGARWCHSFPQSSSAE